MSPSEYQELAEFVATAFDRQRAEMRETLARHRKELEEETRRIAAVGVEALRREIQIVAEGVTDNGRRIEENRLRIEENGRRIEENGRRIEENRLRIEGNGDRIDSLAERFDRFERRLDDHESRLTRLE